MQRRCAVIWSVVLCTCISLRAQNLELIGKEKALKVTGGISLSQVVYAADGIDSRRDPYTYYASGNVNFSLYGWSVPVSFSVSNQQTAFQQPFNQYSVHPTYKWVTGHLGYASMSFSPYTVNGHIFLGGGVDLAPEGNWKLSALYGRFLKAVEPDSLNENAATPAFQRMGYGAKASFSSKGNTVDIIFFRARDNINSIAYVPDSLEVLPEENFVVSLGAGTTLAQHFVVRAEIASSAMTRDIRADKTSTDNALGKVKLFYQPRLSSSYYKAFKTSFTYQEGQYSLGVAYERIDPGYETLGAYYFNNDLENITANGAVSILQGKMNVAISAGTQRDNLDNNNVSTMRRFVGSANVNYVPSQKVNLTVSYSSFQSYTNIRSQFTDINQLTPYDNMDTLNYTQISQSLNAMVMYMLSSAKEKRQSINCNLSVQDAADKQGGVTQNSGSRFYNLNTSYSLGLTPQSLTVSVAFNGNVNESPSISTKTFGPTVSVSKQFFDKQLRTTLSTAYNNSYTNGQKVSTIINLRVGSSYAIRKKHNLSLSLAGVRRASNTEATAQTFTEFTGTLGYSYAFGRR